VQKAVIIQTEGLIDHRLWRARRSGCAGYFLENNSTAPAAAIQGKSGGLSLARPPLYGTSIAL
jgi:hypothetical protein